MSASTAWQFLPPVVSRRQIERFALVDAKRPKADEEALEAAAMTIAGAGLAVRIVGALPTRMVGGRRKIERDGLVTYEEGFSLWREAGAYHVRIAAPDRGNLGLRSDACESLDEATTFLLGHYGAVAGPSR